MIEYFAYQNLDTQEIKSSQPHLALNELKSGETCSMAYGYILGQFGWPLGTAVLAVGDYGSVYQMSVTEKGKLVVKRCSSVDDDQAKAFWQSVRNPWWEDVVTAG